MSRLPIPGSDQGSWGDILNDFLAQSHQSDGTIKPGVVGAGSIADGSVTQPKLSATGGTTGQVLSTDGTNLSWSTPTSSGSVPDATSSVKGLVQLAGDLGGTAGSPTVPGLAGKANTVHTHAISDVTNLQTSLNAKEATITAGTTSQYYRGDKSWQTLDKTAVGLGNVDNTSDVSKPVSTATQTALNAKAPLASPTFSGTVTVPTPTNNTDAATKAYVDATASAGTPDANTTTKGKVQLAGDLAGTAAAPTVAKVNGVSVSGTPTAGQVITASNGTTATWATPSGGGSITLTGDVTGTGTGSFATTIATNAVTEPKLAISNNPSTNQVLSWNGSAMTWVTPSAGGGGFSVVSASTNYTAASGQMVLVDGSSAGFNVTLPAAANGAYVYVKKIDSSVNGIIIMPVSGQIDGSNSVVVNQQWEGEYLVSDGTKWFRI